MKARSFCDILREYIPDLPPVIDFQSFGAISAPASETESHPSEIEAVVPTADSATPPVPQHSELAAEVLVDRRDELGEPTLNPQLLDQLRRTGERCLLNIPRPIRISRPLWLRQRRALQ